MSVSGPRPPRRASRRASSKKFHGHHPRDPVHAARFRVLGHLRQGRHRGRTRLRPGTVPGCLRHQGRPRRSGTFDPTRQDHGRASVRNALIGVIAVIAELFPDKPSLPATLKSPLVCSLGFGPWKGPAASATREDRAQSGPVTSRGSIPGSTLGRHDTPDGRSSHEP